MAAEMQVIPLRVRRLHTKAMRLMLVSRSSRLKPSPLLRWVRTMSPSSTSTLRPHALSLCSMSLDSVLLPAPESPVNQSVKPLFDIFLLSSLIIYYFHLQLVQRQRLHYPRERLPLLRKSLKIIISLDPLLRQCVSLPFHTPFCERQVLRN